MNNTGYRAEWFDDAGKARRDILADMVGTFALIPEVIAFSFAEAGRVEYYLNGKIGAACGRWMIRNQTASKAPKPRL